MPIQPKPKPWYLSKTIQFNLITSMIGIVDLVMKSGLITESRMPYFILGIGIGNIILRSITTKPLTFRGGL